VTGSTSWKAGGRDVLGDRHVNLSHVQAAIVAAVIAAVAGFCGAWLNSHLTTRREQWTFKHDLYSRLLEHLHEASVLIEGMIRTGKIDKFPNLIAAIGDARRARAVARLFLHPDTRRALDELDATWRSLHGVTDKAGVEVLKERVAAIRIAYDAVVAAGHKDLRL
jgi:hypothetical protein